MASCIDYMNVLYHNILCQDKSSDGKFVSVEETAEALIVSIAEMARRDYDNGRTTVRIVPPTELLERSEHHLLNELDEHWLAAIAYDATLRLSQDLAGSPRIEYTGDNFLINYWLPGQPGPGIS